MRRDAFGFTCRAKRHSYNTGPGQRSIGTGRYKEVRKGHMASITLGDEF